VLQNVAECDHVKTLFAKGVREINLFDVSHDHPFAEVRRHFRGLGVGFNTEDAATALLEDFCYISCRRPDLENFFISPGKPDQLCVRAVLLGEV
jgi:hypothetical protein